MKKIITNLLLATIVILTSCSKEEDLLTPVNNPTTTNQIIDTTNQITDTINYTVTGNDTVIVCSWDTSNNNSTLSLEGTKWEVTRSSFYLNNVYPICPIPHDTIVSNVWGNVGEVYFTNEGGGYFETHTYLVDCAELLNEPLFNYWNADPTALMVQPIDRYVQNENQILVNVTSTTGWQYTITLDIVEQTNTNLVLENRNSVQSRQINGQGYPTDWVRDIRLEMKKVN
jgi:hypothetical protein|tara:strand:+ start:85 stop:768 length:684 start_codon:yes stop_codon:yes gene_type:complete